MPTRPLAHVPRYAGPLLLLATAVPAAASLDLTGWWRLGSANYGLPARFTQTGTQLSVVVPGKPATATGTIDSVTGAFSIDLAALYNQFAPPGFAGYCTYHLDAVAAADGNSFTGTATTSDFCVPPPFICQPGSCNPATTVPASGARTLCPDGILEPGEVCDDGTVTGCCDLFAAPCHAVQPAGTRCTDDGDPLTDDVCDAAGTCTHPHVTCPNGVVDPGEQCDDGNTSYTDCCYLCQYRPSGVTCDDDGDPLTRDVCDGAGTCTHTRCGNHQLDPGEVCDYSASGACCTSDCQSMPARGTECDYYPSSQTPDVCDGAGHCVQALWCGLAPTQVCRPDLGGSRLRVRTAGTKSRLSFRWKGADGQTTPADVGNLLAGTSIQLCLYGPAPFATAMVPGGGSCGSKPCWAATTTGFRYRDGTGAVGGIRRARVSVRADQSQLSIEGRGDGLPLPAALPVGGPVTAQLLVFEPGATRCWEAVYAPPRLSTPGALRASR